MREWLTSLIPTMASVSLVLPVWAEVVTWRQTCDREPRAPRTGVPRWRLQVQVFCRGKGVDTRPSRRREGE